MSMEVPFVKIHGAGNDCIFFRSMDLPKGWEPSLFVRRIADRRTGVGSDQVFERLPQSPFAAQVWNQDGTKAEMCGNGSRCFAALLEKEGHWPAGVDSLQLQISGKHYTVTRVSHGYELCLGVPLVEPERKLKLFGHSLVYVPVHTPNPHAVFFLEDFPKGAVFDFLSWGPAIEKHADFPDRTNVEFVHAPSEGTVRVEAWERGAGATPSCGSGAAAVGAALRARGDSADSFRMRMTDYELRVRFLEGQALLSGPTQFVAQGRFSCSF